MPLGRAHCAGGGARQLTDEELQNLVSHILVEPAADAGFRARFSGSPIKRIGRDRFVRNVCYAIGNSGDARLRPAVQALCEDVDDAVRDAARWAAARLPA